MYIYVRLLKKLKKLFCFFVYLPQLNTPVTPPNVCGTTDESGSIVISTGSCLESSIFQ
jgi:hypothetical protein